ncbi:Spt21 [Kluyveromyces lactis]|nr:Spt21 [Kluyveromyces lactis]
MSEQEQVYMTVKVLYTLDNDPNSFLSRSSAVVPVTVEQIPNPNNVNTTLKIGAVEAEKVLKQVCQSSPELFPAYDGQQVMDKNMNSVDFNVYVKDICEEDEPFVSLGLLSKLRQESNAEQNYMIGRVCTNFASMLQRSTSQMNSFNGFASKNTLEIKVRFSKVMTRTNSRRSSISGNNQPAVLSISAATPVASSAPSPAVPTKARRMPSMNNVRRPSITGSNQSAYSKKKRDTNPMPAPKAVRTQSLPIWNNPGIPRNSIAHKIYMADRSKEQNQSPSDSKQEKKLTYQISSLQQDNSVSKFKVDDSISKRFDFMKKKSSTGKKSNGSSSNTKNASITTNSKKQKRVHSGNSNQETTEENVEMELRAPEIFNKENIPPVESNIEELLLDLGSSNEDWFQGLFQSPAKKTPNDSNTFNGIPIDVDRTSPIDTLSMPLVDLEPNSDGAIQVSTGEQLKKLSLLPNIKKRKLGLVDGDTPINDAVALEEDDADEEVIVEDDDATSIMLQFSTSPSIVQDASSSSSKPTVPVILEEDEDQEQSHQLERAQQKCANQQQKNRNSQLDSDDDFDSKKRSTAMPSSPTAMFQYQIDEPSTESEHDFSNARQKLDQDSTPATQYGFSDDKRLEYSLK